MPFHFIHWFLEKICAREVNASVNCVVIDQILFLANCYELNDHLLLAFDTYSISKSINKSTVSVSPNHQSCLYTNMYELA